MRYNIMLGLSLTLVSGLARAQQNDLLFISDPDFTVMEGMTVQGGITLSGSGSIKNTGSINLTGNWTNNSTGEGFSNIAAQKGETKFTANAKQTIGGSKFTRFNDIVFNNTTNSASADDIELNQTLHIAGKATFTKGKIKSSQQAPVTFGDNATAVSANGNSYVNGPVSKSGAKAFEFPIGKLGKFRPAAISQPSTEGVFSAEFFETALPHHESLANSLEGVNENLYWKVSRLTGSADAKLSLFWNDPSDGVTDIDETHLVVAQLVDTTWQSRGNSASQGDANSGNVTSVALNDFTYFALGKPNNQPLPVTLSSFSATDMGDSRVSVTWKTGVEINSSHFDVQRSTDGRDFKTVGSVKATGAKGGRQEYAFLDQIKALNSEVVFYRLNQVDNDGKQFLSETVSLPVRKVNQERKSYSVASNPFRESFSLSYNATAAGPVAVSLVSMSGQVVYRAQAQAVAGANILKVEPTAILPGTYLLMVTIGDQTIKEKVIKL